MKKYGFGEYLIGVDAERTKAYYDAQGPYFMKCACPSCQNFFKAIKPVSAALDQSLGLIGVRWRKPEAVTVLLADGESLLYRAEYRLFGKLLNSPELYLRSQNELGSINVRNPEAEYSLGGNMSLAFSRCGRRGIRAELTTRLPWVMETLNCVVSPGERLEKLQPSRNLRIKSAVRRIAAAVKK